MCQNREVSELLTSTLYLSGIWQGLYMLVKNGHKHTCHVEIGEFVQMMRPILVSLVHTIRCKHGNVDNS